MPGKDSMYLDTSEPIDVRVSDLLGRMTLEEKVCQTGFVLGGELIKNKKFSLELAKKHFGVKGIGGVMDPWLPGPNSSAASPWARQAPIGTPFPSAFATVITSGLRS